MLILSYMIRATCQILSSSSIFCMIIRNHNEHHVGPSHPLTGKSHLISLMFVVMVPSSALVWASHLLWLLRTIFKWESKITYLNDTRCRVWCDAAIQTTCNSSYMLPICFFLFMSCRYTVICYLFVHVMQIYSLVQIYLPLFQYMMDKA